MSSLVNQPMPRPGSLALNGQHSFGRLRVGVESPGEAGGQRQLTAGEASLLTFDLAAEHTLGTGTFSESFRESVCQKVGIFLII